MTFSPVKGLLTGLSDQIFSPSEVQWAGWINHHGSLGFRRQKPRRFKDEDLNSTPASASTTRPFRFFGKTLASSHDPPVKPCRQCSELHIPGQAEERQTCIPAIVGRDVLARVKPSDHIGLLSLGLLAQLQGSAAAIAHSLACVARTPPPETFHAIKASFYRRMLIHIWLNMNTLHERTNNGNGSTSVG